MSIIRNYLLFFENIDRNVDNSIAINSLKLVSGVLTLKNVVYCITYSKEILTQIIYSNSSEKYNGYLDKFFDINKSLSKENISLSKIFFDIYSNLAKIHNYDFDVSKDHIFKDIVEVEITNYRDIVVIFKIIEPLFRSEIKLDIEVYTILLFLKRNHKDWYNEVQKFENDLSEGDLKSIDPQYKQKVYKRLFESEYIKYNHFISAYKPLYFMSSIPKINELKIDNKNEIVVRNYFISNKNTYKYNECIEYCNNYKFEIMEFIDLARYISKKDNTINTFVEDLENYVDSKKILNNLVFILVTIKKLERE